MIPIPIKIQNAINRTCASITLPEGVGILRELCEECYRSGALDEREKWVKPERPFDYIRKEIGR